MDYFQTQTTRTLTILPVTSPTTVSIENQGGGDQETDQQPNQGMSGSAIAAIAVGSALGLSAFFFLCCSSYFAA